MSITVSIGWPQLILVTLMIIELVGVAVSHGKYKPESSWKYNFWVSSIQWLIVVALLSLGGFFA